MTMTIQGVSYDRSDFMARIEWLRHVEPSIGQPSFDHAQALAAELAQHGLPWAYLYPNDEGSVLLEWDAGPWAITVELGDPVLGVATNVATKQTASFEVSRDQAAAATLAMLHTVGLFPVQGGARG